MVVLKMVPAEEHSSRVIPMVRVLRHIEGRLFEWTMSVICLSLGLAMTCFPRMVGGSILQVLLFLVSPQQAIAIFLILGIVGTTALIANGASFKVGPRVRSICAIMRSMLWIQFALSMFIVSVKQGFPSPMIFVFPYLALSELYVVYRAVLDVKRTVV